ncbi:MAG: SH3 domain-containing protein [Methyloceanibacter sp.]|uniref:SH3 domain-containing protein n=1 Tax=Methyloceanibacter sp. TaxID=1965321 RepID=UPI003D9B8B12
MKRLITALLVVFAAVCVVIAFVVSPVEAPQTASKATKLAYEISTTDRPTSAAPSDAATPSAEVASPEREQPDPTTTAAVDPQERSWDPVVQGEPGHPDGTQPDAGQVPDMPPASGQAPDADQTDAAASPLPWSRQHPQGYSAEQNQGPEGQPAPGYEGQPPQGYVGQQSEGYEGPPPQGYQGQPPQGYEAQPAQGYEGQPPQGYEGQQQSQDDWPQDQQQQEQWVRLVGTASMHANPADEAAMLFAFPAGRTLRVVSQSDGWVQVTDPQSAATGWIRAEYLQASFGNGQNQAYDQQAYEEPQPTRQGWLRRNGGGFADMIERAFGGGN